MSNMVAPSTGVRIDPATAAAYAMPADSYPTPTPGNLQCLQVKNVLTGTDDPSQTFYSPSMDQYYCGPVNYPGIQPQQTGISGGWWFAGALAIGGLYLWWKYGDLSRRLSNISIPRFGL